MRKLYLLLLAVVLVLLAAGCATTEQETPAETAASPTPAEAAEEMAGEAEEAEAAQETTSGEPIVVASKNFTEQYILGWMTILALEEAGYPTENQIDLGGTSANREALVNGEVDLYWEYTGTAWLVHLGHEDPLTDSQEAYQQVKQEDMEENNLVWLDYAPFNNAYTLMMKRQAREEMGITEISDLQQYFENNPDAQVCIDQEFAVRPDGLPALQEDYNLDINDQNVIPMEIGVSYKALRDGQCEVAMGFATDGRISAWSFYNLEDDQSFFPVYNPAPVVRQEVLDQYPGIRDVLNPIANALDTETMTRLNSLVDVGPDEELDTGDEREPREVARQFLEEQNLISSN